MRVAVTCENGEIFQHFGHTEAFKVYDVEDGKVISSEIVDACGSGHGALAGMLAGQSVDVLICGGIGGGAAAALEAAGIRLYAGVSGSADKAVEEFLAGNLTNSGANCDHHGHDHHCGEHEDGHCDHHDHGEGECSCHDHSEDGCSCDGSKEGECGGCHREPPFTGKNVGKTCRTHYQGTFNDGTEFDSSYGRGEPLEFVCGAGMMIPGFDRAVANMEVGETVTVHLTPDEAYGEADPRAVFSVKLAELPGAEELAVGQRVYLQNVYGQPVPVKVTDKDEESITFDANHEMAGKELNFKIELVEVLDR